MHNREHSDASRLSNVEDNIGKPRYDRSPYVAIEDRKCFGKAADRFEPLAQRNQKLVPEARPL